MLFIAAGLFYYFKNFNRSIKMEDTAPTSNSETITEDEKKKIDEAFGRIATLYKEQNVDGLMKYFLEAKYSEENIKKNLTGDRKKDQESARYIYEIAFKDIQDNALQDITKVFEKGEYEDGSEYIEMKFSGFSVNTPKEKDQVEIMHEFYKMGDTWYWITFETTLKGSLTVQ